MNWWILIRSVGWPNKSIRGNHREIFVVRVKGQESHFTSTQMEQYVGALLEAVPPPAWTCTGGSGGEVGGAPSGSVYDSGSLRRFGGSHWVLRSPFYP